MKAHHSQTDLLAKAQGVDMPFSVTFIHGQRSFNDNYGNKESNKYDNRVI